MNYSLHNHSTYCDGKNSVAEMYESALEQNLQYFGLSGHAPIDISNQWSIRSEEAVGEYVAEIKKLGLKNDNLKFFAGLEVDFVPNITKPFSFWKENYKLDYIIGAVHLVNKNDNIWFIDGPSENYDKGLAEIFGNNMKDAVKSYYNQTCEMINTEQFDILAHCDKVLMNNRHRFIKPTDDYHLNLLKDTLKLAAEKNLIVEINTRGIYKNMYDDYYPGEYIFKFLKENNIRVMLSADAHLSDQITKEFEPLSLKLKSVGIKETWLPEKISKNPIPIL